MDDLNTETIKIDELLNTEMNCNNCSKQNICIIFNNMKQMLTNVSVSKNADESYIHDDASKWLIKLAQYCSEYIFKNEGK